jgi:hypothetical protein
MPTFPDRQQWDSYHDGKWRDYWFCFWATVAEFYNAQAVEQNLNSKEPLWKPNGLTNLTKSVTLRCLQSLFMKKCVDNVREAEASRTVLFESLAHDLAEQKYREAIAKRAIPADMDRFRNFVVQFFLDQGIPARIFANVWDTELQTSAGMDELFLEFERALDTISKGGRYRVARFLNRAARTE